jgi:hypothetical protein
MKPNPPKKRGAFPPEQQPGRLNDADALKLVRLIAVDSDNIIVVPHGSKRSKQRLITRIQIERCVRMGVLEEGPFIDPKGKWRMTLTRHTAGEKISCVVAIEWTTQKVLVITTF